MAEVSESSVFIFKQLLECLTNRFKAKKKKKCCPAANLAFFLQHAFLRVHFLSSGLCADAVMRSSVGSLGMGESHFTWNECDSLKARGNVVEGRKDGLPKVFLSYYPEPVNLLMYQRRVEVAGRTNVGSQLTRK